MFEYNHELHNIENINQNGLHLYPTRTRGVCNVLSIIYRNYLKNSRHLIDRIKTHSIYSVSNQIECCVIDLFVCCDWPVIIGCTSSPVSRSNRPLTGRWLKVGRGDCVSILEMYIYSNTKRSIMVCILCSSCEIFTGFIVMTARIFIAYICQFSMYQHQQWCFVKITTIIKHSLKR